MLHSVQLEKLIAQRATFVQLQLKYLSQIMFIDYTGELRLLKKKNACLPLAVKYSIVLAL